MGCFDESRGWQNSRLAPGHGEAVSRCSILCLIMVMVIAYSISRDKEETGKVKSFAKGWWNKFNEK
jgi:hypothetical protein